MSIKWCTTPGPQEAGNMIKRVLSQELSGRKRHEAFVM